jgi:hypothetical protein
VATTSQAYQRFQEKSDQQETEIECRLARLADLQCRTKEQRQADATFLANLSLE